MRIGYDARILTVPRCGGVTYLARLLQHLPLVAADLQLVVFLPAVPLPEYADILAHPRIVQILLRDADGGHKVHMPRLLEEHRIDIYHQPFNADGAFFRAPCPVVVSILDLIPWVVPGIFRRPLKAWRYKARNILWAHTAARVLTISEASKRDIVRLCRVPVNKVAVTLLGADDIDSGLMTDVERNQILRKLNIGTKKYIINMGGLNQARRHPDFILEGFARYLRDSADDCYLVITGSVLKQNGFFERVQAKMAAEGITDRVILTGFLSSRELKVVLSGAVVSVITSLYEGFCLPLTESFSCGVAVIANDRGSIPEIAGDAAVLVDPHKPRDLARWLLTLISGDEARRLLIHKGRERIKLFDWENTARQTAEVYREAVRKAG